VREGDEEAMMKRVLGSLVMMALAAGATPAGAEWAIELYGGATSTESTDLDVSGQDATQMTIRSTLFDVDADTGFTAGLRIGYWFESAPFLGLALDTFYFSMPVSSQTVDASSTFSGTLLDEEITFTASGQAQIPSVDLPGVAFAPQLALRWPLLVSKEFPSGRLQPYVAGGPAWALSIESDEEFELMFGGMVRGGMSFKMLPFLGLFAEYRYSFFPEFEVEDRGLAFEADLNTHHVVLGLSFTF
jgi:opacity protein-like surface antigen